jgi:hypothetical protein
MSRTVTIKCTCATPDVVSGSEEGDFIELINMTMNDALNAYDGWVDSVVIEEDDKDGEDEDDDKSTTHD